MSEKLLLFAVFIVSMLLMGGNHRRKRKKIVFFGDSVTSLGARPGGFITLISKLLKEADAEYKYELINAEVDGNSVTGLLERVDKDILSEGADIVVILIGLSDVWQTPAGNATGEIDFESAYEAIIKKIDAAAIKMIVCTPTVIGERIHLKDYQDFNLEKYSQIIRNLSVKYELSLADLRKAFINYNLAYNTEDAEQSSLTTDKVNYNNKVNQLVAAEIWKVLQQLNQ